MGFNRLIPFPPDPWGAIPRLRKAAQQHIRVKFRQYFSSTPLGFRLVRVALRQASPGSAAGRARELLESAIDPANPESTWRLYEGEMVWNPVHPVFEQTAERLTRPSGTTAVNPFFCSTSEAFREI
jgi:hypothetical protein